MSSLCHFGLEEEFGQLLNWGQCAQQPKFGGFSVAVTVGANVTVGVIDLESPHHCVYLANSQSDSTSGSRVEENFLQVLFHVTRFLFFWYFELMIFACEKCSVLFLGYLKCRKNSIIIS